MTITKYSSNYFHFLSRWITNADLLFQFAGTEFSYPITEKQIEHYQHKNPDRSFYIGLNKENEAVAFGEIIPQENNIPRIGRLLIGNPADRGKGFGTSFIHLLLAECKKRFQTETVELFVLEDNLPAIHCYQKIGFRFSPGQNWEVSHNGQTYLLHKMAYNF
ncbi:GNAT family protein [uncultured Mucilaginibacter sp.]|uniref:GNAT family N-acetyltransferase n=1 Tax=uncultured Mucilaginibacter sp. TaxID=797541 RepID=UPI0026202757|nr:GNAT family protein [uncultured Mucilaginibacter sp.]